MKSGDGVELEVMHSSGGNPQRIAWLARCKDLAALEVDNTKMGARKQCWAIVGKASEYFVAGSLRDTIWYSV